MVVQLTKVILKTVICKFLSFDYQFIDLTIIHTKMTNFIFQISVCYGDKMTLQCKLGLFNVYIILHNIMQ